MFPATRPAAPDSNPSLTMIHVQKLTTKDAAYREVVAIRRAVFVEEQGVPAALELDGYEDAATFFLAKDGATPLGTGRFRTKGPLLKFERIATVRAARGRGVGTALMAAMERDGAQRFPRHLPYMHAQLDAVPFYEKIGWTRVGDPFFEADIPHFAMLKLPSADAALKALLCWGQLRHLPADPAGAAD